MGYLIPRDLVLYLAATLPPHSYMPQFHTSKWVEDKQKVRETGRVGGDSVSPWNIGLCWPGPWMQNPPLPFPSPTQPSPAGWTFQASRDKDEAAGPRISQQALSGER